LFLQKKNSFAAQARMEKWSEDRVKSMDRKLGFLNLELKDIKNNKGTNSLGEVDRAFADLA